MVAADLLAMYLHIFQDRLGCISHGCQEGALQTAGKGFQSAYSEIQTCCNVVQSNLSDIGLGGHLGGGSRVWKHTGFLSCVPLGNFPSLGTGHRYPTHSTHKL